MKIKLMWFLLFVLCFPLYAQELSEVWQSNDKTHRLILLSSNPFKQVGRVLLYGRSQQGSASYTFVNEAETRPCRNTERECFSIHLRKVVVFSEGNIGALATHKKEAGVENSYMDLGVLSVSYIRNPNQINADKPYMEIRCESPGACYLRKRIKLY